MDVLAKNLKLALQSWIEKQFSLFSVLLYNGRWYKINFEKAEIV